MIHGIFVSKMTNFFFFATYNASCLNYKVMDGAPVRGECTPIRIFLSPYDLTPTYKNVDNKFSVKYVAFKKLK